MKNNGKIHFSKKNIIAFPHINIKLLCVLCITGFIMHSFRYTQMLNNHDDIGSLFKTYGVGTTSGRWGLSLLGDFVNDHLVLGSFNLPIFDGMVSLVFISLSACIILEIFNLQKNSKGYIFGILFISFPTYAGTLLYMYTVAYYGLSCLLAVLAVYFWKQYKPLAWILGILCASFSIGIYQAYFPVTVCLVLMVYILYIIQNNSAAIDLIKKACYYIASLLFSLAGYYLVLQIILKTQHLELSAYQGISQMGNLSASNFLQAIKKSYLYFVGLATKNYHNVNTLSITKWCLAILSILTVCIAIYLIVNQKGLFHKFVLGCSILLLPVAVNFIEIMCNRSYIYELMVYSVALAYALPLVLLSQVKIECLTTIIVNKVLNILLVIVIVSYIWIDNWNYVALDYVNKQTESYMTTVITSIKLTEGYKDDYPILFIGEGNDIKDLQYKNPYANYPQYFFLCTDKGSLLNTYTWKEAFAAYTGFSFIPADNNIYHAYKDEIASMPCYPDYGSIKVIDETVVVKFSEYDE